MPTIHIFQSTPPVKAATKTAFPMRFPNIISIHAAREGGDALTPALRARTRYFNPRRP